MLGASGSIPVNGGGNGRASKRRFLKVLSRIFEPNPFPQRSVPEILIIVALGERIEIDPRSCLRELEPSEQVDVLPGDGRDVPANPRGPDP
jgi:hypothetical protein